MLLSQKFSMLRSSILLFIEEALVAREFNGVVNNDERYVLKKFLLDVIYVVRCIRCHAKSTECLLGCVRDREKQIRYYTYILKFVGFQKRGFYVDIFLERKDQ